MFHCRRPGSRCPPPCFFNYFLEETVVIVMRFNRLARPFQPFIAFQDIDTIPNCSVLLHAVRYSRRLGDTHHITFGRSGSRHYIVSFHPGTGVDNTFDGGLKNQRSPKLGSQR